ncbi:MAG: hypothetical protein JZD41_02730 [Thermoproteus sp.]|nr:hypothetical protein [Thermoproteus sp.]
MIIFTDQMEEIYKIGRTLASRRIEPVVIKGERVDYIWPPQVPSLPFDLLRIMPRSSYVIIRGNILTIVP